MIGDSKLVGENVYSTSELSVDFFPKFAVFFFKSCVMMLLLLLLVTGCYWFFFFSRWALLHVCAYVILYLICQIATTCKKFDLVAEKRHTPAVKLLFFSLRNTTVTKHAHIWVEVSANERNVFVKC